MAIDTTPSTVATNALQAIPFSSLIGGPLDAAIQAQAMAAKTSWEFIQQVGLNTNAETGEKNAVNVTFYYNKNGNLTKLIVPLLTIVPIPYIAIDDVQINFKANISAAASSSTENTSTTEMGGGVEGSTSLNYGIFKVSADFKANYSSKKDSKATEDSKYSVEYTMDVAVHAGQSDMPAGLASVLNILQSSITDADSSGTFNLSPAHPQIDLSNLPPNQNDFTLDLKATVKNSEGLLIKNQDVSLELPTDLKTAYKLEVDGGNTQKTNSQGMATFQIKGTASKDSTPNSGDLVLTAIDGNPDAPLETAVELNIIGKLPEPPEKDKKPTPKQEE